MILNLNKLNVQKQSQNNLMSSQSFLLKNKITINEVTKAHFTAQGVQMYSPGQIKALKQTQQRSKGTQNKQAVEVKVYQIGDYFDQFQQSKELNPKQKVQQLLKTKYGKDLAKNIQLDKAQIKGQNNLTVKQKVVKNKMALTKLQKQRNKKNAIETKLIELSKHYKQYFNQENQRPSKTKKSDPQCQSQLQQNNSLTQSIQKITKSKQNNDSEQQQSEQQLEVENNVNQKKRNTNKTPFNKNNKKVLSNSSTNYSKILSKNNRKEQNCKNQGEDSKIVEFQDVEEGLDLIGEIINNRSTYSQKLGSAVHLLFN